MGKTWTSSLVFHAPLFTALNNIFPSLAVDPTNGKLYATWSDAHNLFFSTSSNQGTTWSNAVIVNIPPANTAIFPWVAIDPQNGLAAVVYTDDTLTTDPSVARLPQIVLAQQSP